MKGGGNNNNGGAPAIESPRTGKRGDRQTAAVATTRGKQSAHKELLAAQASKTVAQRLAEARKSHVLDLTGLGLSLLPDAAWDLDSLRALLLGNNAFEAVPPNLANSFPALEYLDLSRNAISSVPSSLADLPDLRILDFSNNPNLSGYTLPAAYGPIRHQLAVFIDDENIVFVDPALSKPARRRRADDDDENNENNVDTNNNNHSDSGSGSSNNGDDDDDDDDNDDDKNLLHERSVHKRHDLAEDAALNIRKFFKMVRDLEDAGDLVAQFKRLAATQDVVFIKYITKRYHSTIIDGDDDEESDLYVSSDDGGNESFSQRKQVREAVDFDRKEKEKWVKGSRAVGRNMKASRLAFD
ncbi:hypothetical protein HK100_001109 [Physocladia obscura]|uniref:Uncharacterized protein n=1 Tax=Physocladia obscura TaxID=109957 RepID=A0AAD5T059_9FUNG|nr:hypothetical protein HK100_001109 [Physocladia obscura]